MAGPLEARLKAIADKPSTSADDKGRLQKLAGDRELTATTLIEFVRASKLPIEDRRSIAELAAKLTEEHKWLTPHELDEAKITDKGETLPFLIWAASSASSSGSSTTIPSPPNVPPRSSAGASRSPSG